MKTCQKGHELTPENSYKRPGHGIECRSCRNHRQYRKPRTPEQLARAAKAQRDRRAREAEIRPKRKYTKKVVTDGFEDDFGPIPVAVPDAKWHDEVIVHRALSLTVTRRKPTPLEARTIVLGARQKHTNEELARVCGVDVSTVTGWKERYGQDAA